MQSFSSARVFSSGSFSSSAVSMASVKVLTSVSLSACRLRAYSSASACCSRRIFLTSSALSALPLPSPAGSGMSMDNLISPGRLPSWSCLARVLPWSANIRITPSGV